MVSALQLVARAGRIVVTSLHQPSPAVFSMLDRALLMAQGHVVFEGPPSAAPSVLAGYGLPCPQDMFIAEHMLEVMGLGVLVDVGL